MGNDRKDNFIRLAEARTNKILKLLTLLGNLSNKSYYDYSESQVETMFNVLQEELDNQKARFYPKEDRVKKFRL